MTAKRFSCASMMSVAVVTVTLGMGSAASAACPPANPEAISGTIQAMYSALATGDVKAARSHFAPDFYLFDGGSQFDADGILALIQSAQRAGKTFQWTVTQPKVHFACRLAWITYVNQGGVTADGHETQATWLESGILRHAAGRWAIQFMQSTRVPPKTAP